MDNLKEMLEALLFSSGKSMPVEQLSILTNMPSVKVKEALVNLRKDYEKRSSLMIVEEDNSWKLTVREGYLPLVRKIVADTELPKTIIETLAVIAWRAPVSQSSVVKIRTNKAYDHIAELERLGFLNKEKEGRSFKLKLTEKFFDYFDVTGKKDVKQIFKDIKGIKEEAAAIEAEEKAEAEKEELAEKAAVLPKDVKELLKDISTEEKGDRILHSEIEFVKPANQEVPAESKKEAAEEKKKPDAAKAEKKEKESKKPEHKEEEKKEKHTIEDSFSEKDVLEEFEAEKKKRAELSISQPRVLVVDIPQDASKAKEKGLSAEELIEQSRKEAEKDAEKLFREQEKEFKDNGF
jgi:segregation and condensation protein B